MRFRYLLFLIILLVNISYCQDWQIITSLNSSGILRVAEDGNIYSSSMFQGGVFRSTNNGNSWTNIGTQFGKVSADPPVICNGILYVSAGTVFKSTNNGSVWVDTKAQYSRMATNGNEVYGLTNTTVIKTSDNGNTWKVVYTLPSFQTIGNIVCNGNNLFVACLRAGICRSTNNGNTWEDINNGFDRTEVYAVYSTSKGLFMVTANAVDNIYKSTNNGDSWFATTLPSETDGPNTILESKKGYLLAVGASGKVYKSVNSGNSWFQIRSGVGGLHTAPGCVALLSDDNIMVGNLNAIYRTVSPTSVSESGSGDVPADSPFPTRFSLSQNYPNPFNPSTSIRYSLPYASDVRLTIWNTLGKCVCTLIDKYQSAGEYSSEFNTSDISSNVSSGIYFYRLEAGEYIYTKKMLLLK